MAAAPELMRLGRQSGDTTVITLSVADQAQLRKTERVLLLMGWKVSRKDGGVRVEPGDQAADGPRHQIPLAFGIDEPTMRQALEKVTRSNSRFLPTTPT
jgi:hypothetical protein